MNRFYPRNGSVFSKMLLTIACISIIPTIIISIILYEVAKQNINSEVNSSNMDLINQIKINVDSRLASVERISMQAMRSNAINKFWNTSIENADSPEAAEIIRGAINTADSFIEGMIYVENISVYSFANNMLITSGKNEIRRMDRYFLQSYDSMSQEKGFVVWIEPGDTDIFGEKSDSIQLVSFVLETFNQPKGIIVIKLMRNALSELISTAHIRNHGYINIVNTSGKVITLDTPSQIDIDFSRYWKKLNAYEGSDLLKHGIKEYLFTFSTSTFNNWKYVGILPTSEINYNGNRIISIIVTVCLLTMGVLFIVSFLATKGLYTPIALLNQMLKSESYEKETLDKASERKDEFGTINRQLLNILSQLGLERASKDILQQENQQLKQKLQSTASNEKNYFFYKLLRGDISDLTEMQKHADSFGLSITSLYIVSIVELGKGFELLTKDMTAAEQDSLKVGIVDIFIKSMPAEYKVLKNFFEISNGCDRIVFIMEVSNYRLQDNQILMQSLKLMCNFVKNIIQNSFGIDVTIAIGKVHEGMKNIKSSYDDAVTALKYKFVMGTGITILKSEIEGGTADIAQENYYRAQVANCLKAKNLKQIENIFTEFKQNIKKSPVSTMISSYYCKEMISEVLDYLNEINYSDNEDKRSINKAFVNFENTFDNIFEAIDWLYEFIKGVYAKCSTNDQSVNRLIKQAIAIVENEYSGDLSLTYISEKLNISEQYLSKLFKEETGKNYKDYLSMFRIKKAKELLGTSNLPIYEISSKVGYNYYNQFKKAFTKYEGVSPAEYREATM